MIRKITLLVCFCMAQCGFLVAQHFYSLRMEVLPYTPLTNAIPITLEDAQGGGRYFSYDLKFKTFTTESNFKANTTTSLGAFVSYDGYLAVYNAPGETHTVIYQLMLLKEANGGLRTKPNTKLSYKYEGVKGSGILKVEWENMGIKGHHDSEYVNMQLWLNEKDNSITYHYGAVLFSGKLECHTGLFTTPNNQFGTFDNAMNFEGSPLRFSVKPASGFVNMPSLDDLPKNGRSYKFFLPTSGIDEEEGLQAMKFYPNPASTAITLTTPSKYLISDITGKIILQGQTTTEQPTINTEKLAAGVYYIQLYQANAATVSKLVITK